jgi:ribonucleotide reductase class II
MKVIKRDNSTEEYDVKKIENVLKLAFTNSNTECSNMSEIVNFINKEITENNKNNEDMNIETLQNIIEKTLMIYNYFDTAKHYIEYRNKRNEDRKTHTYISKIPDDVDTPWGMLGYITFKRTYARRFNEDSDDTEEFRNTILRVLDACQKQLKVGFTNEELKNAYKYLMGLKCSVAGRFLWQLGTETVDRLGLMSLQNCAFVAIDEPIKPFLWIFDVLMLGTGVGFNIQREYVSKLPNLLDKDIKITRVDTKDADFIVPDSREGWVALLEKVFEAFYYKGKSFSYSTILIRTAGAKIKGFGGTASGPEDLVKGINNIQNIFKKRKGQQLTSVDCLDIINIIASVVVAGNVRRCIKANSLVHTREGLVKIQDIKVGDEVLTSSGYEKVANTFIQGKQNLIKIITQDGEFECTPNHRMAIVKTPTNIEWKMACELTENDILTTTRVPTDGVKTELPSWCYDNKSIHSTTCKDIIVPEFDADMAWLIGIFQADGYTYPNYNKDGYNAYISLVFGLEEYDMAEKVKEQLQRFGYDLHIRLKRRKNENSYMVHCQSKQLAYYFDKNVKQANSDIEVPEYIKKAKQEIKLAYIAGIIDGDGCVKGRLLNLVSTVSLKWAKEIQALCYSCGFETRLNIMKNIPKSREGWQPLHKLNIITKHSQNIVSKIPQLFKKFNVNKRVGNSNGFPIDMVISYINDKKYDNNLKRKLGLHNNKQLVIDTFEDNFGKLNYCPTKILRIEDNDEDDTFDIEVENKHEFYCNGYLTHNSALISLGDYDDIEYLKAKDWSQGNIPNWRCMSNNSVVCDDTSKLPKEFWEGYNGTSEPYGLINIELSRKIGRIKDGSKYPDPTVKGYNPCAEISISNFETCCLGELFLPNITSFEELKSVATVSYRICKHSLLLKCHHEDTENIVHKNSRIGIGITGFMQSSEEQKSWLSPLYEYLREYDVEYSKKIGAPTSIKLTTVKPSGTLSLLAGVTSGCHPGIYQYFIRRIRIASNNGLIQLCKSKGYFVEYQRNFDGTDDKNTMIVEFPCMYPIGTKLANEMSAIDQLEMVKLLQTNWSDNAVSCTIYYRLNELEDIKKWLIENYKDNVKTCSFLLHNDHGFKQAPFEEITKEKYDELIKKVIPITSGNIGIEETLDYSGECANGVCPIR